MAFSRFCCSSSRSLLSLPQRASWAQASRARCTQNILRKLAARAIRRASSAAKSALPSFDGAMLFQAAHRQCNLYRRSDVWVLSGLVLGCLNQEITQGQTLDRMTVHSIKDAIPRHPLSHRFRRMLCSAYSLLLF